MSDKISPYYIFFVTFVSTFKFYKFVRIPFVYICAVVIIMASISKANIRSRVDLYLVYKKTRDAIYVKHLGLGAKVS